MNNSAMFKEIGSNFWLAPAELETQAPGDFSRRYVQQAEHTVYTSSGRGAISLVLEQIAQDRRVALLPLYTCESVIMPFLKKNYEIQFYDLGTDLSTTEHAFMSALENADPGVVLVHAYFGSDTLRCLRPLYSRLRKRGIVVVEDITHSLFSDYSKTGADYYVASLRKWFALPDGGVAISPEKPIHAGMLAVHEELVRVNLKAIAMKNEYVGSLEGQLKVEYRKLFYATEEMLNNDCGVYAMSEVSHSILSRTDYSRLAVARRDNFKYLLAHLKKSSMLTPVFRNLPDGVVPLYFPVYLPGNRDKLRAFLAENEIYAPVHWPVPAECSGQLTESARYVYDRILSIPCDQRYGQTDMERIVAELDRYRN
jgi:dTDP-4-amino-4,6-dideoxygalactose transaminase